MKRETYGQAIVRYTRMLWESAKQNRWIIFASLSVGFAIRAANVNEFNNENLYMVPAYLGIGVFVTAVLIAGAMALIGLISLIAMCIFLLLDAETLSSQRRRRHAEDNQESDRQSDEQTPGNWGMTDGRRTQEPYLRVEK